MIETIEDYGLSITQGRGGGCWIVSNGIILDSSYENLEDTETEFYIVDESLEEAITKAVIKYRSMEALN